MEVVGEVPERLVAQVLAVLAEDRAGLLGDLPVVEVAGPEPPCPEVRSALAGVGARRVLPILVVTEAPTGVMLTAAAAAAVPAITEVEVVALVPPKTAAPVAVVVGRAWSQVQTPRKLRGWVESPETPSTLIGRTTQDSEAQPKLTATLDV